MPGVPLYVHRLEEAIGELSRVPLEWVDRRMLGEALGVSKWTAWRLLRRCGAEEGPGGSLVCRREALIERLQELQRDGTIGPEIARRKRLEEYLGSMIRPSSRQHKEIASNEAATDLLSSRFGQLPDGVELGQSELRIQFSGSSDFLRKFGAVVYALNNDYEAISEYLDAATAPNHGAGSEGRGGPF